MSNFVPDDPSTGGNGGTLHAGMLFPSLATEDSLAMYDEETTSDRSENGHPHGPAAENTPGVVAPEGTPILDDVAVDRVPDRRPRHAENVVDETLEGLDAGLGDDYTALDKAADRAAGEWAESGLPRCDLEAHGQLDVESTLEHQARHVFLEWTLDVRRRVDAAIAKELRNLTAALRKASAAVESYRAAADELNLLNPRAVQASRNTPTRPVERAVTTTPGPTELREQQVLPGTIRVEGQDTTLATRHLRGWFWPLMFALVVAEFVGNAPVFTELFPPNAQIDRQLSDWLNASAEMTWTTGLEHFAGKVAAHPAPAVLTLSVVVFLLFLGHQLGGDLRTWMSVRRRHPEIDPALAEHLKRQSRLVASICGIGILVAITVLFMMRATVEPTSRGRALEAEQRLVKAETELDKARHDPEQSGLPRARQNWSVAVEDQKYRDDQLGYATSISRMNRSITGLNIVLVLVATIVGFYRQAVIVTADQKRGYYGNDERQLAGQATIAVEREAEYQSREGGAAGDTQDLAPRIRDLRSLLRSKRLEIAGNLAAAHRAHANGVQLLHCEPMREWKRVVNRLQGAIPRFRAENARLRGLDPRDIKAFRTPATLEFAEPRYESDPQVADQFAAHMTTLNRLVAVWDQLSVGVRQGRRPVSAPQAGRANVPDGVENACVA